MTTTNKCAREAGTSWAAVDLSEVLASGWPDTPDETWNGWTLDDDCLVYEAQKSDPIKSGQTIVALDGRTPITCATVLHALMSLEAQWWAHEEMLGGLVRAVQGWINPQRRLCSFGGDGGAIQLVDDVWHHVPSDAPYDEHAKVRSYPHDTSPARRWGHPRRKSSNAGTWRIQANCIRLHVAGNYRYSALDLDDGLTCARVLDMIVQVAGKRWCDDACIAGMLHAIAETMAPLTTLCPDGVDLGPCRYPRRTRSRHA